MVWISACMDAASMETGAAGRSALTVGLLQRGASGDRAAGAKANRRGKAYDGTGLVSGTSGSSERVAWTQMTAAFRPSSEHGRGEVARNTTRR